jgi:hypothetical protein
MAAALAGQHFVAIKLVVKLVPSCRSSLGEHFVAIKGTETWPMTCLALLPCLSRVLGLKLLVYEALSY